MTTPYLLGRKLEHDPRSRSFPAPTAETIRTIKHRRYGAILDQGNVGSCTGNALAAALNTVPLRVPKRVLHQSEALRLYCLATELDGYEGTYPPDDTGSSGLGVCKAGVAQGYLTSYRHAFGFNHYLATLMLTPVIVGVNWYEDFFTPDADGFIWPNNSSVVGGHEIEILGYNAAHQFSWAVNSWGRKWGLNGCFKIPDPIMRRLLHEDGDVAVPVA